VSTTAYALRDSATTLRRNPRRLERYPSLALFPILIPFLLVVLFVYVFGGTLGNEFGGSASRRSAYVNYLAPGILVFTVAGAARMVAIAIATDMTEGIIARFRTMAIWRPSVRSGHVLANVIQSLLSVCAVLG
jgi:ABC-2 type transport system permease protein